MKKVSVIILMMICMSYSCKIKKPVADNEAVTPMTEIYQPSTNFSEQSTWLLGYFTRDRMAKPPHSEWYNKGYGEYQVNADAVSRLAGVSKDGLTIKSVMGTWCPDSRREVPRFMRVLDIWKFPVENVTFIGVDNVKISPVGEYDKLDIQRVPTFIFYKNNIEAGRIIEVPLTSLEQDMINILTKE